MNKRPLTNKQRIVHYWMVETNATAKEIARETGMAPATIANHWQTIKAKRGYVSRWSAQKSLRAMERASGVTLTKAVEAA